MKLTPDEKIVLRFAIMSNDRLKLAQDSLKKKGFITLVESQRFPIEPTPAGERALAELEKK